ncbi:rhodanese-like domain-containing protein [Limnohabitans sp.]|jgi:rhodanese-related sulfurtransferase|uniref:rhodanese-like domain-containing protein n=1 Tax=Limnohabitans sp. TaxID=1907725 RepID=UPI00286F7EFF|nr:rhodanese-like domain-containing protein [Limnohabitans sp.]
MIDQIQPAQLQDWIVSQAPHGATVVLDVREPWEVQTACVKPQGFELVEMVMHTIPARLQDLNRDQPIACLCHHGARSMQVAAFLAQQGFSHVANISGGIHAWSSQVDASVPTY